MRGGGLEIALLIVTVDRIRGSFFREKGSLLIGFKAECIYVKVHV